MIRCLVRRSHGNSKLSYLLTFWYQAHLIPNCHSMKPEFAWLHDKLEKEEYLSIRWFSSTCLSLGRCGSRLRRVFGPILFWFYLMSRYYSRVSTQLGMPRVQHGGAAVLLFMFELLTLALRESRPTLLFCDILWLSSVWRHFMTILFWSLPRFHDCRWELEQSWTGSCINDVIY